jgi:hypothetical protein
VVELQDDFTKKEWHRETTSAFLQIQPQVRITVITGDMEIISSVLLLVMTHTFLLPSNIPIYVSETPRRYPYFGVVWGLVWSNDPRAMLAVAYATGRASHARQVKGDDPD